MRVWDHASCFDVCYKCRHLLNPYTVIKKKKEKPVKCIYCWILLHIVCGHYFLFLVLDFKRRCILFTAISLKYDMCSYKLLCMVISSFYILIFYSLTLHSYHFCMLHWIKSQFAPYNSNSVLLICNFSSPITVQRVIWNLKTKQFILFSIVFILKVNNLRDE